MLKLKLDSKMTWLVHYSFFELDNCDGPTGEYSGAKISQKIPKHVLKNHWDCCDFSAGDCRLLSPLTLLLFRCCCCCYRYCSCYRCRSRCFHHSLSLCDIQQFAYNFDYSWENFIWMWQLGADLHVINAQNAHLRLCLADCSRHCATSFTDGCFRFLWSDKCHKTCPKLINLRLSVFGFFLFTSVQLTASNYRFDINEWDCMCVWWPSHFWHDLHAIELAYILQNAFLLLLIASGGHNLAIVVTSVFSLRHCWNMLTRWPNPVVFFLWIYVKWVSNTNVFCSMSDIQCETEKKWKIDI